MKHRSFGDWAQTFVYPHFLKRVAWGGIATCFGVALLLFLYFGNRFDMLLSLFLAGGAGLLMFLFLDWMTLDVDRNLQRIHQQHVKEAKPQPDGNMAEVANLPKMPPWTGTL